MAGKKTKLEEVLETQKPDKADILRTHEHPKGWEPSMAWDGSKGYLITVQPDDRKMYNGVWEEIIKDWGLDPEHVALDHGSIQLRGWDANVSEGVGKDKVTRVQRMLYYRANLVQRQDPVDRADVDTLIKEIKKKAKVKRPAETDSVYDMVVCLSDWQVGKGEGDGSQGTVDRVMDSLAKLVEHIKDLRKVGRGPRYIYATGMGDLVEQCSGHYPMQAFQTDLDRREQMRVVRRLILAYVDALIPLCQKLVLVAVPGNHGENRNGSGKAFTTFADNDDLAVFDGIAEILSVNPDRYGHVSVLLSDKLSTTFRACATDDNYGVVIGISHMHAGRSGKDPRTKVLNWWKGHALGRGDVHDADILVTGHYHHFMLDESSGRTWLQCPAQDPGSAWFEEMTGQHSPHGMLIFSVSEEFAPRKWGDLVIL